MPYILVIMPKAQKYLDELDNDIIEKIAEHTKELKENPYKPRPLADIIKLSGFKSPPMYRLRVGRQRLEYYVDEPEKTIYITKAFPRSGDSDYR